GTLRLARSQAAFSPLMGAIAGTGGLIVLWLGGGAVIEGRITLGDFVAFSSYLAYLAWPLLALGWVLAIVRRGLTALDRVVEILTAPIEPAATGAPAARLQGAIEFRGVTFDYGGGRPAALRHGSLRIPAGGCVAVIGPTGAGKSPLAALLTRLWEPPPGTVLVDGRDIRSIPLGELRSAIGYVPQETFLFSRSLADNVMLGDPGAAHGRLERA